MNLSEIYSALTIAGISVPAGAEFSEKAKEGFVKIPGTDAYVKGLDVSAAEDQIIQAIDNAGNEPELAGIIIDLEDSKLDERILDNVSGKLARRLESSLIYGSVNPLDTVAKKLVSRYLGQALKTLKPALTKAETKELNEILAKYDIALS